MENITDALSGGELSAMATVIRESIALLLSRMGIQIAQSQWLVTIIYLAFSVIVALLGLAIARLLLRVVLTPLIARSKNRFDDLLIKSKTLKWMARTVPFFILYIMSPAIFDGQSVAATVLQNVLAAALLISVIFAVFSLLNAVSMLYDRQSYAKQRPIKGYMQIVKVMVSVATVLLVIGIIFDASLWGILGGLGAFSAVVLLIFQGPILALVASLQLTLNNMVRIGDWVEIPGHSADGTVIEMNLQSIRIQNWDKTIVSVPLYDLVSKSFANWRGMEESGGRRIKRALHIDITSVKFCTPDMIEKFKGYALLRDYVFAKELVIAADNTAHKVSPHDALSGRAMTNIGTFRAYASAYLSDHPDINHNMTCMVRQRPPMAQGIPIECYCFSAKQDWVVYESIQSDIFDHLIAIMPIFELRIFQSPTGHDIERLGKRR